MDADIEAILKEIRRLEAEKERIERMLRKQEEIQRRQEELLKRMEAETERAKQRITEAGVNAEELMENLETLITVPRRIEIPALSAIEWENLINALEQINDVSADSKEFIRQIIKFGRREIARGKVLMALAELANKGVNVRFPPFEKKYRVFNEAFDATLRRGIAIGDTDLELIVDKINAQKQAANSGERKRARRGTYKEFVLKLLEEHGGEITREEAIQALINEGLAENEAEAASRFNSAQYSLKRDGLAEYSHGVLRLLE